MLAISDRTPRNRSYIRAIHASAQLKPLCRSRFLSLGSAAARLRSNSKLWQSIQRKPYTGGKEQLQADAALVAHSNVSRKVKAQRRKAQEALRRSDLPFRRYFKSGGATFSFVLPV